jgi:hypothetical protein
MQSFDIGMFLGTVIRATAGKEAFPYSLATVSSSTD